MKKAVKACAFALGAALIIGFVCSGCKCVDCTNSDTAEFPTVEKWWK